MPQIIMLSHASRVNAQRLKTNNSSDASEQSSDEPMFNGKPIDQLNSEEMKAYLGS